ncbi:hypothetical protein H8A95_07745 [Bradyrhizobium sp. Pear76]|uniref:hypothetical protein n=1 Tax=Bradyrhizobium oropedii TaxID=1571201 RepID=UPI001E410D57|nr:hypothetical protein [Bradyrhizobium oropedii]MCC8962213.1 hypothetical protein [Bradyrhizobium oropedii]
MDPSRTSVHSTGAGMHASAMKPAATAATEAAAAASTTGISVIRKQADGNENYSCQNGEDTTKHGVSSLTDEIANDEAATISVREIDVDQRNAIALKIATLRGRAFERSVGSFHQACRHNLHFAAGSTWLE